MNDVTEPTRTADPEQSARLRDQMIAELIEDGALVSGSVEAAMRAVPREAFAPETDLETAYNAFDAVVTKRDDNGNLVSSVSAPQVQAVMLEQAELEPGMRVLEIGSGGYNAALIAELVGPNGQVTTVDIDEYVTERAQRFLTAAGYTQVNVVLADADQGVPEYAPYDRVLVTVGAWDIPPAWRAQLAPGGRLMVPLRMRGLTRTVAFEQVEGHLVSRSSQLFGFVPMRGAGEYHGTLWTMRGGEVSLRFDDEFDSDPAMLEGVFGTEQVDAWSDATIGRMEPMDTVQMWLATVLPGFCMVHVDKDRDTGVVALPGQRTSALAAVDGPNFVYITTRATDDADSVEFGAHAYGPAARELAEAVAEHLRTWSRVHRGGPGPRIDVFPADTPDDQLPAGRVIDKTHSRITLSWPEAAESASGRETLRHTTK